MIRNVLVCIFFLTSLSLSLSSQFQFQDRVEIPRSSAEVGVADFNKDGHPDIAVCNRDQRWYAGPDFTTWHKLGDSDGGPYAARVADINGDGWDDFITSDGTRVETDMPGNIYVYLNPTDTGNIEGPWERIIVYTGAVRHQNDMRIVDMDNDGRLDIIERTWSSERVVVALQNADINNWTVRAFDTGETGKPEGISAGDLDGDNEMEIVLSGLYWDNPGGWRTGTPVSYPIDANFIQEEVKSAVGDIDNDGDNDVYMGSAEGGYVYLAWYENTGLTNGGVNFTKHIIKDNFGKCHMIELIDIDNDNDLDLCTASAFGDTGCYIFFNENNGTTWTEQNYDANGSLYTGIVADLDADGDYDIVGPSGFYDPVYYYINEAPISPPGNLSSLTAILNNGINIELNWTDTLSNVGSYEIERKINGSWEALTILNAGMTFFQDNALMPNTLYSYRIRARNSAGNSDWLESNGITTWQRSGLVSMDPISGNYVNPPLITLSASIPFGSIYYTLDGTLPDINSNLYSEPFLLNNTATVNAISIGDSLINSLITTEFYNVAINGNFPPIANAGPDQSIFELDQVILNGSQSSDLDDTNLIFQWEQIAGPSIIISNSDSVIANFQPTLEGDYLFKLIVSDEQVSDLDTISITVNNLDEGLLAYWRMDQNQGICALELINDYNALLEGGNSWLPNQGKIDGALNGNGIDNRAEAPAFDVIGDSMTITCWIKVPNLDNVEGRILSKANGVNENNHFWMLSQNGGSALRFRLKTVDSGTSTLISPTGQVVPNEWLFVAAVYDGITMRLYKNLNEIASLAKTGIISTNNTIKVAIGNQPDGAGERPFNGAIDDLRIYDTALNPLELENLYNNSCSRILIKENETFTENTTLVARQEIRLNNVNLDGDFTLELRAPKSVVSQTCNLSNGAKMELILQNTCIQN